MRRLSENAVKKLKPTEKTYYVCDGEGLNISVMPNGTKYWILRYTLEKRERKKSLGKYPQVSLSEAREQAYEIKKQLKSGTFKGKSEEGDRFCVVAEEWMNKKIRPALSRTYIEKTSMRLEKYILPVIGEERMLNITSRQVLDVCREIEALGTIDTAHRVKQIIGQVFRYAIAAGYADNDPTTALVNALQSRNRKHHACLTDAKKIAQLMKSIYTYKGRKIIRIAMLFSALTFCRPGEIRRAEWDEIDFEKCEWKIPAEKMKMKRMHIVPLSKQSLSLLGEARELTGNLQHVFHPMSDGAIRYALRSMGYSSDEMTAHGFRGTASTMLSEQGWNPEIIERQLAHSEKNASRAAYCHAEYLPDRQKMMQSWADYIYSLICKS